MAVNLFVELSLVVVIAVIVSGAMRLLKQPLIIGYILTGIIAGPFFLDLLRSSDTISFFSQIGITFLLFLVGLNLNPKVIKDVGLVSVITGVGQVIFTSVIGFLISIALGFDTISSLYIAVALTFSSTIIITKLLSDKNDIDTLYGKISIGFLIVQDLIAVLVLMFVSSFSDGHSFFDVVSVTLLNGAVILAGLALISIFVLPLFTRFVAKSQEFLLLFAVGWCFAIAALFYNFNFSMEMGALLAGIALSMSPYRYEISSKMTPLRDFFLVLFFVWLGSQMVFSDISQYLLPTIILSLVILIGNPFIVMAIMGFMRYTKRTGFFAGLTVAQIGEFSLILIALGVGLGHVSSEILSFMTIIALVTLAGSTYFVNYNERLYHLFSIPLSVFERKNGRKIDESRASGKDYEFILFGYNRIGFSLVKAFKKAKKKFLIVDYNPSTIAELSARGIDCLYGDAHDGDLIDSLNLSNVKLIFSTIPDKHINLFILDKIRKRGKAAFIATSHGAEDSFELYRAGAAYVIMPHFLGGDFMESLLLFSEFDSKKIIAEGKEQIKRLNERVIEEHTHPKKDNYGR